MGKLAVKCMTREAFERMPEYSRSNPTGLPVGKRWRRKNEWLVETVIGDGAVFVHHHEWVLCEVTHHTVPARDRFDRPLSIDEDAKARGERGYPIGEPSDRSSRIVHISCKRIAVFNGPYGSRAGLMAVSP